MRKEISVEISDYIVELTQIDWLKNCGSNSERYHVIYSIFEAYDDWNEAALAVWEPHIDRLEVKAQEIKGDAWIDEVFETIAEALYNLLWEKWTAFLERCDLGEECGLDNEMLDMIIRDMSWAYIERTLETPNFFAELLEIYKEGFFPCSWDGNYPEGKAVVL